MAKTTQPKKETAKAEPKAAVKAEAVKADVKAPVKEKAPRKPAVKKVEDIYVQFAGYEWDLAGVKAQVVADFVAQGHKKSSLKKLSVYVKPEEGKVFYVANDDITGSIGL